MYCFMICLKFFISILSKQLVAMDYWLFCFLLTLCVKWFTEAIGQFIPCYCETNLVEFLWLDLSKGGLCLLSVRLRWLVWNLSLKLSTMKSFLSFSWTKFSIRHSMSFFIMLFWVLRWASTLKYFLFFCNIFSNILGHPKPRLIVWHLVL